VPTPDGGDDFLRVGGPDEWLGGFAVVLTEIAADGVLLRWPRKIGQSDKLIPT